MNGEAKMRGNDGQRVVVKVNEVHAHIPLILSRWPRTLPFITRVLPAIHFRMVGRT